MEENKGEDLYEELRKTLAKESEVEEPSVATDQESPEEKTSEKEEIISEDGDLTEEEISKLHPKAQKRIKELADKVKELAEKPAEQSPDETPEPEPLYDKYER